ncbi:MAG: DUF4476 domain-containing protein [Ferruginibacter sp.]
MKTVVHLITMLLLSSVSQAQQYYFVYIQTDNKQPFYIKVNDKVMSSSASGYVVIPKLTTGNYTVTVGFPKDQWPQQTMPLGITNADAGYLLKNFGDKGWGLYNLQTMAVVMNNNGGGTEKLSGEVVGDVFTNTLAGAANTELASRKNKKVDKVAVVEESKKELVTAIEEKQAPVMVKNTIKKLSSATDEDGNSYTYIDRSAGSSDTINIFIPVSKAVKTPEAVKPAMETEVVNKETKPKKFLDIDLENPNAKNGAAETLVQTIGDKEVKQAVTRAVVTSAVNESKPILNFNSDCKATATEGDFLKVRKKMASSSSDDAMVGAAKKAFKSTCYSVEQIKNLSLLFLNDAGKYNFFDASYPHIYDTQNFGLLQSQLSDQYYITRFKAMIRN